MSEITQLTPEQEAKLTDYFHKAMEIGLCTDPIDFEVSKEAVKLAYRCGGLEPPKKFIYATNPLTCIQEQKKFEPNQTEHTLFGHQIYGCHDIYWLQFYNYFWKELGFKDLCIIEGLLEVSKTCGWWAPYEDIVFIQDRPTSISFEEERLHCEDGPAITYLDDFCLYALHGVQVPDWLVLTDPEDLDASKILEISNAQVRAEGIRKIGMERLIESVNPTILDEEENYRLLDLRTVFNSDDSRLYLQMKNPSVDLWHVEGVGSICQTIQDALDWRKPEELKKIPMSPNGDDWYQQGDVCVWPSNAKSVKPRPTILT